MSFADWVFDRRALLAGTALGVFAGAAVLALSPEPVSGAVFLGDLSYACALAAAGFASGLAADFLVHRRLLCAARDISPRGGESLSELLFRLSSAPAPSGRLGAAASLALSLARICAAARVEGAARETQDRSREDGFAALIHELKTPVTALRLYAEKQSRLSELSPGEAELLDLLGGELDRIDSILERGLFASRAESFASDYLIEETDLRTLAARTASRFAKAFVAGGISFSLGTGTARVLTDPKWLSFVISQVFSNSLKYVPRGGSVSLRVIPASGPDPEPRSGALNGAAAALREDRLVMEDSGPGFAPEDLPRVFDRGYSSASGRAERAGAACAQTGMGLYLASRLCARLGHSIDAGNGESGGARIVLGFPRSDSSFLSKT